MTDVDALIAEARRPHYRMSGEAQQRLLNALADALEAIITDTTSLLEEGATRIEALNRENQALAQALEARIEPFVPWAATQ